MKAKYNYTCDEYTQVCATLEEAQELAKKEKGGRISIEWE